MYVRQIITRVFSFAIVDLKAKNNPAREIRGAIAVPQATHHKPIAAKDLPAFIEKLARRYSGRIQTKLAAKLLLLTMVRKCELIETPWDEIDLDNALWAIPPERMKRRAGHVVPLSKQALKAYKTLKPISCGSRYVFPNFVTVTLRLPSLRLSRTNRGTHERVDPARGDRHFTGAQGH